MSIATPPSSIIAIGDAFWSIRGSFKIKGIVDVGTQASLVRLANGKYVSIDAVSLTDEQVQWMDELTHDGADIDAIINVHPFHTVFIQAMHERYPHAKLFGTERHASELSSLPWETLRTEDAAFHAMYADDFDFSVPRGVDFIPADPNLHFSSVLVFHRASKTLHVDDTLCYVRLPHPIRLVKKDWMTLHPTLAKVLERRAGAVADFRDWAHELVERCRNVDNVCAAHSAVLLGASNRGASVASRVSAALRGVDAKLDAHALKFG